MQKEYIVYKVKKDDTEKSIANQFKVDISSIKKESSTLQVGDRIIIDLEQKRVHIVKPGETIAQISKMYNVSQEELINKNEISRLFVGQRLFI